MILTNIKLLFFNFLGNTKSFVIDTIYTKTNTVLIKQQDVIIGLSFNIIEKASISKEYQNITLQIKNL